MSKEEKTHAEKWLEAQKGKSQKKKPMVPLKNKRKKESKKRKKKLMLKSGLKLKREEVRM